MCHDISRTATIFTAAMSLYNLVGWIKAFCRGRWRGCNINLWWVPPPLLALLATFPFSLRAVRRLNHDGIFLIFRPPWPHLRLMGGREAVPRVKDEAEERRQIMAGDFLRPLPWNKMGVAERLLARILSPHEQVIAEMLLTPGFRWSGLLFGLISCLGLFLAANTEIPIWTLDQFTMAMMRFDRSTVVPLVACIASLI